MDLHQLLLFYGLTEGLFRTALFDFNEDQNYIATGPWVGRRNIWLSRWRMQIIGQRSRPLISKEHKALRLLNENEHIVTNKGRSRHHVLTRQIKIVSVYCRYSHWEIFQRFFWAYTFRPAAVYLMHIIKFVQTSWFLVEVNEKHCPAQGKQLC